MRRLYREPFELILADIKNAAFIHTQFTEFIYLDSVSPRQPERPSYCELTRQDNIPLSDPAELFDTIEYQQSGSVFWADLNKDHGKSAFVTSWKKR